MRQAMSALVLLLLLDVLLLVGWRHAQTPDHALSDRPVAAVEGEPSLLECQSVSEGSDAPVKEEESDPLATSARRTRAASLNAGALARWVAVASVPRSDGFGGEVFRPPQRAI